LSHHILNAFAAVARNDVYHIKENLVCIIVCANLGYLIEKVVKVACVIAKSVITGSCEIRCPSNSLVLVTKEPFGADTRDSFVKARRKIYGSLYTKLVRCGDLLTEKVEMEIGVHFICTGGVIRPTMMAFGKKRDRVNVTHLKARLELLAGKFAADVVNVFASVKIEMYLSESHSIPHNNFI
jgi:hypothetical protein